MASPVRAHDTVLPADERTLVARIRAGDERAFEIIARAYYPSLRRFATRLLDSSDVADDVLQDLFLHLWINRAGWDVRDSLRAYLYSALRHRASDRHKLDQRAERRSAASGMAESVLGEPADAHRGLEQSDLTIAVRGAVAALPERCRMIYLLSRDHEFTYPEIARVLGLSVNTVKTQMGRAFRAIRLAAGPFLAVLLWLRLL